MNPDRPADGPGQGFGADSTMITGSNAAFVPADQPFREGRVGRYAMDRMLGRGGMASVYLAREDDSDRLIALKVMSPALRDDPSFVTRFLHEARATRTLHHPNIVELYDAGEADGQYFMATEFVDGGTVGSLLEKMGAFPAALAQEVMLQLLAGLVHAHAKGVVHRDLKPENLLLTSTGVLKVADFGIARTAEGGANLTRTGMLIGTASYMSPEQARGARVDARSDLYTAGIILYELLSGQNPYASENAATSITRILTNAAPPICTVKPSIPAHLEQLLEGLLQADPAARVQSAQEAHDGLLPHVMAVRHAQPGLLSESLRRPGELRQLLDTQASMALLAEALPLLGGDPLTRTRGAIKLFYALQLDPHNAQAERELHALAAVQPLYFGPSRNPKLAELEGHLEQQPQSASALMQAAQLSKVDGNPVKAAVFLKRYLLIRPQDAYAAGQLRQLTGEVTARQPVTARQGSSTADLVAGIKTGGLQGHEASRDPTQPQPMSGAPVSSALLDLPPVAPDSPLRGLLMKLSAAVLAGGLLVAGYRKLSRSIDVEANRSVTQDGVEARALAARAQQVEDDLVNAAARRADAGVRR